MIGKLRLVMLMVSDMSRSVAFYRDVLELDVEYESEPWSQVRAGDVSIGLHHSSEGRSMNQDGGAELGFYVDDVQIALDAVRERGAEVVQEVKHEEWGVLAVIKDPDGYTIQILELEQH
ncbi:MAG: VOC family protein [Gaiellaceae bacterium]